MRSTATGCGRIDGDDDYTVSGLACGKSYRLEVDAYDAAGNRSGQVRPYRLDEGLSARPRRHLPRRYDGAVRPDGRDRHLSHLVEHLGRLDRLGGQRGGYWLRALSRWGRGRIVRTTNATFSGLVCGRSYQLAIDARDANGNRSAQAGIMASTSPCPDTQAPSVPPALTQAGATETTAWISWGASTDNVGVAGYGVYVAGVRVGSTSSRAYTFTALGCGSTYTVGVDAYDAAGIRSARVDLVVATSACVDTAPPSTPTGRPPPA